jgi:hypothetical protein
MLLVPPLKCSILKILKILFRGKDLDPHPAIRLNADSRSTEKEYAFFSRFLVCLNLDPDPGLL